MATINCKAEAKAKDDTTRTISTAGAEMATEAAYKIQVIAEQAIELTLAGWPEGYREESVMVALLGRVITLTNLVVACVERQGSEEELFDQLRGIQGAARNDERGDQVRNSVLNSPWRFGTDAGAAT